MTRTKIDYGIDLGTTNSAISRMVNGEAKIIKSLDTQKDTSPSCVAFNKKGSVLVGDSAYRTYRSDSLKALAQNAPVNSFVEFKRTMGTDKTYFSSYLSKDLSSEELSAEVLKRLKEYVSDENFNAAVVTVPAAFRNNQIDATRRAGKLAGFDHVEVLQEPVAAAMAYGLESKKKDGFWLVFDFGGGTFDSALLKVEDGIMEVVDTEGDNHLGGKNLDYAIVDEIIIPHIQKNFEIDELLSDNNKKAEYRGALKFFAEEIKNNLSFNSSHNIYVDPGECGEDDAGEEIEIDLTVSQDQLKKVMEPIFQKAIDCSLALLERNNLTGKSLDSLILVGGPTLSPILREMLEQKICAPDTSVDPMTVVSMGAALYASTVNVSEEIREQSRDKTKIQLEIGYEASTVETEEYVTIKILEDKTEGEIPDSVFAEISRGDKAWGSGKVPINAIGEVIDVHLNEGKTNVFEIRLYDTKGNSLESEPKSFSIIQGSKIGSATLPYNIGIEIKEKLSGKVVFKTVKGLEKNKSLPAPGTYNDLKTQKQIRPGNKSDFIKIPIYQGEHGADDTRAIYNEHVYDVIISGADLPALLPENSSVDLIITSDKSQKLTVEAFFPYLDHTAEIEVPTDTVQSVKTAWLANEIRKAKASVEEFRSNGNNSPELDKVEKEIDRLEGLFENAKEDIDTKQQVVSNLRKVLKVLDKLKEERNWPDLEKALKDDFYKLEKVNSEKGNEQTSQLVNKLRQNVEEVIAQKSEKMAPQLLEDINTLSFELERLEFLIGFILFMEKDFTNISWKNSNAARSAINRGKEIIFETPSIQGLQPIVNDLYENSGMDKDSGPLGDIDNDVLVG